MMGAPAAAPPGAASLEKLRRRDKHYLAAGDGVLFDPTHPQWLERPGFWDAARLFLHTLQPVFTVTFLGEDGRALALPPARWSWTPAAIEATYAVGELELEERRVVLPGGHFASQWSLRNAGGLPVRLHAVAWTAQEGAAVPDRSLCRGGDDGVELVARLEDAQSRLGPLDVRTRLRIDRGEGAGVGWAVYESQYTRAVPNLPEWDLTPLRDHWSGGLRREARLGPAPQDGGRTLVYAGTATLLRLEPNEHVSFAAVLTARPVDEALALPERGVPEGDLAAASEAAWGRDLDAAPAVEADEPHLDHYFPYRWYGLRLNYLDPAGSYGHPTVAEGIEYFHCAISYSAWCHMRELRWLPDPARARGTLLTFLDRQRENGMLPGRVYLTPSERGDFYFADWGGSVLALHEVHPDRDFLRRAYPGLVRYAEWLDADRDPERSGLYTVRDPYETGQENMSRYTAVDPEADRRHFEFRLRLKGVDATVYTYRLRRALARVAAELGESAAVRRHDEVADRIAAAVRDRLWDPDTGMFSDVDPRTMERTGVRAAVCFYPYMTDLVDASHLPGLERHLFDRSEFWLPWPVPSTAASDPTFDAEAVWREVRQNCTWNGRVWPMTNSHVCEALARAATLDPRLGERAAELLMRYLRMLCFDGDPGRPNCFEHYSPVTGRGCVYRGIDDYQHSWINDLVVRLAFGVRPRADGSILLDPLPCGLGVARLERLPFRGRTLSVTLDGERVRLTGDGVRVETRIGEPAEVRW